MEASAKELETRVQEAHERYVTSKNLNNTSKKIAKRSSSDRQIPKQENAYTTSGKKMTAKKRNLSIGASSK